MPNNETGHAKNVSNFGQLTQLCQSIGPAYNPSNPNLSIAALLGLKAQSEADILALSVANATLNARINERAEFMIRLKPLSTRILNALKATGADLATVNDLKTINRKIQGKRAVPIPSATAPAGESGDAVLPKTISSSQQSFDLQSQHLRDILEILRNVPSYTPNENGLRINELQGFLNDMVAVNSTVQAAFANVSAKRLARNETMYDETLGIPAIANLVKIYVKSVFGASAAQYKQISKIKFSPLKF